MAHEYNTLFTPGDKLVVELKSREIFNGIYVDGGKDRIVLSDVTQHNNKNKLGGLYEFYRSEIVTIHKLKAPPSKEAQQKTLDPKASQADCKVIKITEEEYFRLKDMSNAYVYIDNADKRYFDAVKSLGDSETIGVVCLGMEKHRARSFIPLLVMSDWKQVYIFDLIHTEERKLYVELKGLLESEHICKVMHKSAGLVDVLYRHYNVYVQNTFDTQIVDLIFQKSESGTCTVERDLSECLTHYLNFPSSLLENALAIPAKEWKDRPLPKKTKLYAAQLVTYLILLKEHFQKLLLKNVYGAITKVQDRVYDMDDADFLNYNIKKDVSKNIESIIPNLNKLGL